MYTGMVHVLVFALVTSALLSSSTFTTSTWPLSASRETKSCGRCGRCSLRHRLANSRKTICKRGQQRQRHHRGSGCRGQHWHICVHPEKTTRRPKQCTQGWRWGRRFVHLPRDAHACNRLHPTFASSPAASCRLQSLAFSVFRRGAADRRPRFANLNIAQRSLFGKKIFNIVYHP